jgi:hypothetical protein
MRSQEKSHPPLTSGHTFHFCPTPKAMMEEPLRVRKYFPPFFTVLLQESRSYSKVRMWSFFLPKGWGGYTLISQKPAFRRRCFAESTAWKAVSLISREVSSSRKKLSRVGEALTKERKSSAYFLEVADMVRCGLESGGFQSN